MLNKLLPQSNDWGIIIQKKEKTMKKILSICLAVVAVMAVAGCCNCQVEPIVEQNQKLIVPPNFGNMPK